MYSWDIKFPRMGQVGCSKYNNFSHSYHLQRGMETINSSFWLFFMFRNLKNYINSSWCRWKRQKAFLRKDENTKLIRVRLSQHISDMLPASHMTSLKNTLLFYIHNSLHQALKEKMKYFQGYSKWLTFSDISFDTQR